MTNFLCRVNGFPRYRETGDSRELNSPASIAIRPRSSNYLINVIILVKVVESSKNGDRI